MESFLDLFFSLNFFSSSPKHFHISFSFTLDSSWFPFLLFFFKSFFFFGHLSKFLFSFFNSFLHLFLLDLIKIINIYRLLFISANFITHRFIVLWVFPQGTFQLYFILVRFKDDVKIAFQIETTFFCRTMNFRKNVSINVLKYVLVTR